MFTLEQPENPLARLLANATSSGFQKHMKEAELQKRTTKTKSALSKLTAESSVFDVINAIQDVPEEDREGILKVYDSVSKAKKGEAKTQNERTKLAKEKSEAGVLGKYRRGEQITPEEEESLSAQSQRSLLSAQNKGGITSKPVPSDVGNTIKSVLDQNKGKTADELALAMDEAGIPRTYSNSYVENRRRQDEKTGAREELLEKEQAKADVGYQKTLPEMKKALEHKKFVNTRWRELNKKGVTGKPYEKFLEKWGLINLTSEGRREAGSLQKEYAKEFRQILGSQMSAQEFFTLLNAYPNPDFSMEANDAILNNYEILDDIKEKEIRIAQKLLKEHKGRPPRNFELEVANQVEEYAKTKVPEMRRNMAIMQQGLKSEVPNGKVLMYDPEGNILHADPQDVEQYQQLGATLP